MRAHLLERSQRVLHIIAIRPASQPQGPGGWREHERGARGRPPRARRADCEDRERGQVSAHDIRRPRGRGELRQRCTRASYALRSSPRGPGPPPPRRAPAPCSWGRDCDWVVITELVRGNEKLIEKVVQICFGLPESHGTETKIRRYKVVREWKNCILFLTSIPSDSAGRAKTIIF